MDKSKIKKYNSDIANWLSKQSIFYQAFNSFRIVGLSSSSIGYFFGVIIKITLLLLVLALFVFLYFARQHNDASFSNKMAKRIQHSLKAENVKLTKLKGGTFSPVTSSSLLATGTEQSFFDELNIYNMKMDLGNMVFKTKKFATPSINCSKIDMQVKISASPGNEQMYSSLFDVDSWFKFTNLDTRFFNCKWGYSTNSKGEIKDSKMSLKRSDKGCEIKLTGGTLTYSWLKNVDIESMTLILTPEHFIIKEALFKRGDALFTLQLQVEKFGELPLVRGKGDIINCDISELIREEYKPYIHGIVNSSYEFSGSPNAINGMDFLFKPLVRTDKTVAVTGTPQKPYLRFTYDLPLIKALGAVDRSINYRSLKFEKNNWEVEIKNGEIIARDVTLPNEFNKAQIKMQFALKSPSQEYIDATMNSMHSNDYIKLLQRPWLEEKGLEMLTLKKSINGSSSLTYEDYVKLLRTEKHFYGDCAIEFHSKSISGKDVLQDTYPADENGIRTMEVPLEGHIKKLTQSLANDLYYLSHKIK